MKLRVTVAIIAVAVTGIIGGINDVGREQSPLLERLKS